MGSVWRFRDYVADDGTNEIRAWLDSLPKTAKVRINAMIRYLETERNLRRPGIGFLTHGDCDGLMEIRVKDKNVQYRPLCCYGPEQRDVTILFGAKEKGDRFVPETACSSAQARRLVITQKGRVCDHDFG